jgi:predicted nucleic acid-binding Zn ribbon protein
MGNGAREYSKFAEGKQKVITEPARSKKGAVRLGDVISELMDNQISQRQAELRSVEKLWISVLPTEMSQHCKIAGISSGKLLVQVDSPSYMYELQLVSCELLKELRRQHPRVPVEKIKLALI